MPASLLVGRREGKGGSWYLVHHNWKRYMPVIHPYKLKITLQHWYQVIDICCSNARRDSACVLNAFFLFLYCHLHHLLFNALPLHSLIVYSWPLHILTKSPSTYQHSSPLIGISLCFWHSDWRIIAFYKVSAKTCERKSSHNHHAWIAVFWRYMQGPMNYYVKMPLTLKSPNCSNF